MPTHPPFRKVFPTVAPRSDVVALLDRHRGAPVGEHPINDSVYAGDWFEIGEPGYQHMLDVFPPMFFRPGVFAVSEFKGGKVASVFVTLTITGRHRWFLGFCDLEIAQSPEMLRDAILVRETGEHPGRLSREEKLEIIWNATHFDSRGDADLHIHLLPPEHRDWRTILVNSDALGTVLNLLEDLTDAQIAEMLPADLTRIDFNDQGGGQGLCSSAHPRATTRSPYAGEDHDYVSPFV